MHVTPKRRYRATLVPTGVPLQDAEVKADQGALPFVQFLATNAGRAEQLAYAVTGLPVLRVDRVEAPQ